MAVLQVLAEDNSTHWGACAEAQKATRILIVLIHIATSIWEHIWKWLKSNLKRLNCCVQTAVKKSDLCHIKAKRESKKSYFYFAGLRSHYRTLAHLFLRWFELAVSPSHSGCVKMHYTEERQERDQLTTRLYLLSGHLMTVFKWYSIYSRSISVCPPKQNQQ